jgi:hypothetical protein
MCAACGVPTHVAVLDPAESPEAAHPAKFAALRNPECRRYLGGATLAMKADALGWSSAALCACVAVLAVYLAFAARRAPAHDVLQDAMPAQEAGTSAG